MTKLQVAWCLSISYIVWGIITYYLMTANLIPTLADFMTGDYIGLKVIAAIIIGTELIAGAVWAACTICEGDNHW